MRVYLRVTRAEDSQREDVAPLFEGQLSGKASYYDLCDQLAAKHGFEVIPEAASYKPAEWPLTAVAYQVVRGGRSSTIERMPCRKKTAGQDWSCPCGARGFEAPGSKTLTSCPTCHATLEAK